MYFYTYKNIKKHTKKNKNMKNAQLFTAAHKLARTFEGNYSACFVLALQIIKSNNTETPIEKLTNQVREAKTPTLEGRELVTNACKELYDIIESGLYNKYGEAAIKDAYSDLCEGDFAEPFMCEQKKTKFTLYSTIFAKI